MKMRNIIIACLSGTALEWFDFSLFGVFAPVIAAQFFPHDNAAISLIKVFAVFSTGFIIRPMAAIYWGYWGDKWGRKPAVIRIVWLMTFASLSIGLMPTYSMIGIMAPVLLVMARILQGFSASGEHAGMLTYLYEIAPYKNKGLMSSMSICGVFIGMSLATLSSFLVYSLMSIQAVDAWGWRLPFLCSGILGFISWYLRHNLEESNLFLTYQNNAKKNKRMKWLSLFKRNGFRILRGVGIFQLAVIIPYVAFVYLVALPIKHHTIPATEVYSITCINLVATAVSVVIFGYLSNTHYKRLQYLGIILLLFGIVFLFPLLYTHSIALYGLAQLYFGISTGVLVGPFCVMLSQTFDTGIRYTGIAVSFNIAATIFGGLAPMTLSLLQLTDRPIFYAMTCLSVSCLAAWISLVLSSNYRRSKYVI